MVAPAGNTLKPCLAELLRTCVHPSSLVLRCEHVFGKAQTGSRGNVVGGRKPEEQGFQEQDHTDAHQDDSGDSDNESPTRTQQLHYIRGAPSPSRPLPLRLVLSDGHLQIQAVIAANTRNWREVSSLQTGDNLEIAKFDVRSAPRLNGRGRVVYLGIQECALIQQDRTILAQQEDSPLEGGGFLRDADDEMSPKKPSLQEVQSLKDEYRSWSRKRDRKHTSGEVEQPTSPPRKTHSFQEVHSDDDEGFDTLSVSQSQIDQRRADLRNIQESPAIDRNPPSRLGVSKDYSRAETPESLLVQTSPLRNPPTNGQHVGLKAGEHDILNLPTTPFTNLAYAAASGPGPQRQSESHSPALPGPQLAHASLNTVPAKQSLASILMTRPQKSYPCPPIFALISWISPSLIHRPNTPFPPKRHLKIHDPSISNRHSGLTVAVFVDAINFTPQVGTVALFKGLVMNWVRSSGGDIILNRYPLKVGSQLDALADTNRQGEEGDEWFVEDEEKLVEMGYDVQSMRNWWAERRIAMEKGK
ncbi:hypothetical protein H2200_008738 [Cladophialophora chaetospira]|uniref:Uncharacterized protein n=1 Tax=Cladophialophora chaetospira TaxID=386627 RepID=A0AA39CFV7_9EURO|nr:hypothetical protein H2200_008738 [Cladophialophora chaetospira]